MDVESLKEYIYKENKIEYILEQIGNHSIQYHPNKNYYSCGNVANKDGDGDNTKAVTIKNNKYLNCRNYTREKYFDEKSDLISLVQYNKGFKFHEALKYIHELLGLEFTYKKEVKSENKVDPLSIFKRVKKTHKKNKEVNMEVLEEEVLNDYVPCIHINWVREGITKFTAEKFQLGYSFRRQRIIIPVRYWLTGELIGIVGRTMIENYKEFDIPKFLAIKEYEKSNNLYGLYENLSSISKAKYVVVHESEKSTLKRHSLLDGTGVSVGCHDISDEQVRILLGLDVDEIVISFDNDVDINYIRHCCEKFYHLRKISYIYDRWNLLGEKECAADKPNKIYEFLFKYRTVYDEKEHNEYIKSLERKKK